MMNLDGILKSENIVNYDMLNSLADTEDSELSRDVDLSSIPKGELIDTNGPGTYYLDRQGECFFVPSPQSQSDLIDQFITDEDINDIINDEPVVKPEPLPQQSVSTDLSNVHQTITIVPTASASGELNYVLIVQETSGAKQSTDVLMQVEGDSPDCGSFEKGEIKQGEIIDELDPDMIFDYISSEQKKSLIYNCSECDYTTHKKYVLARHMMSHSDYRPFTCEICHKCFKNLLALQNHVNAHLGTKPHACKSCDSTFTTSGELARHFRYKHMIEKPHKCPECEYASVELYKLKRHVLRHARERTFPCTQCSFAAPNVTKLKLHMRTHAKAIPELFSCDSCHSGNMTLNDFKKHRILHNTKIRPTFPCKLCSTSYTRRKDLHTHIQKMHFSDKPIKCERCEKSFPDRYSYKEHYKSHKGLKIFKCDICFDSFISQRQLQIHLLVHTNKKLYSCEECFQDFEEKYLLTRHLKFSHTRSTISNLETKGHECIECKETFINKDELLKHMDLHDSLKDSFQDASPTRQKKVDSNNCSTNVPSSELLQESIKHVDSLSSADQDTKPYNVKLRSKTKELI